MFASKIGAAHTIQMVDVCLDKLFNKKRSSWLYQSLVLENILPFSQKFRRYLFNAAKKLICGRCRANHFVNLILLLKVANTEINYGIKVCISWQDFNIQIACVYVSLTRRRDYQSCRCVFMSDYRHTM